MASPWLPSTTGWTCPGGTPSSAAAKLARRDPSSNPAMPMTLLLSQPVTFQARRVISSRGLVTMMRTASGAAAHALSTTSRTTAAFFSSRSERDMPGARGNPAVTTTTSLPAASR